MVSLLHSGHFLLLKDRHCFKQWSSGHYLRLDPCFADSLKSLFHLLNYVFLQVEKTYWVFRFPSLPFIMTFIKRHSSSCSVWKLLKSLLKLSYSSHCELFNMSPHYLGSLGSNHLSIAAISVQKCRIYASRLFLQLWLGLYWLFGGCHFVKNSMYYYESLDNSDPIKFLLYQMGDELNLRL